MKLYIKNMVCARCKMAVAAEFEKAGIKPLHIELGEVDIAGQPDPHQFEQLSAGLEKLGFEFLDDHKSQIIAQIKAQIVSMVHYPDDNQHMKLSVLLADKLHHDYKYLSNLFSTTEGTTIEKYYIAQKIERVKELLIYDQLSLSQIAYQLNYSSVAYLSSQFKQVTGLTPSAFKALQGNKRTHLEDL